MSLTTRAMRQEVSSYCRTLTLALALALTLILMGGVVLRAPSRGR